MPSLEQIGQNAKTRRDEFENNSFQGRELFFTADGDLANLAIVPSGSPEESDTETRLLDYHQHSERVTPTSPQDSGDMCLTDVSKICPKTLIIGNRLNLRLA